MPLERLVPVIPISKEFPENTDSDREATFRLIGIALDRKLVPHWRFVNGVPDRRSSAGSFRVGVTIGQLMQHAQMRRPGAGRVERASCWE